jgi:hypothetical protein
MDGDSDQSPSSAITQRWTNELAETLDDNTKGRGGFGRTRKGVKSLLISGPDSGLVPQDFINSIRHQRHESTASLASS